LLIDSCFLTAFSQDRKIERDSALFLSYKVTDSTIRAPAS
jgi:hypothetical protein